MRIGSTSHKPLYLRQHRKNTVKLALFATVMTLIFAALAVVFSQVRFSSTEGYHAVFTDASNITSGSKVRIAGVPVGTVTGVQVGRDNMAHVDFDVESKYRVLQSTRAAIRYEDLVGNRYLELMEGPGSVDRLSPDSTIPKTQTAPALDLDQLLGGFKPLLRGLNPGQTNALTSALIDVFQGQGETLVKLLTTTGDFANSLADRDQVIGEVIDNLDTVLKTIADKGTQFDTTMDQLQKLISGLAADRDPIGAALPRMAAATAGLASLLQGARPDLAGTINQAGILAGNLNAGSDQLQWTLDQLPEAYRRMARISTYGSFMQLYLCTVHLKVAAPDGTEKLIGVPAGPQGMGEGGRCSK